MPIDWRFQLGLRLPVHRTLGPLHTGFDFETVQHAGHNTRGNDSPRPSHQSPILFGTIVYGLSRIPSYQYQLPGALARPRIEFVFPVWSGPSFAIAAVRAGPWVTIGDGSLEKNARPTWSNIYRFRADTTSTFGSPST